MTQPSSTIWTPNTLQLNPGDICRIVATDKAPMPPELIGLVVRLAKCYQSERDKDYFWSVSLPDDPETTLERDGREVWIYEPVLELVRRAEPEKFKRKRRRTMQ